MIHSEENNGFDIGKDLRAVEFTLQFLTVLFIAFFVAIFLGIIIFNNKEDPTTKPPQTELDDKCPANTFEPIKLTGSFNSIKTDSVKTDKLNFPMWCPLVEDKPRGWGLKK
jgi:hypothetical protein